jgi:hypothetical protein
MESSKNNDKHLNLLKKILEGNSQSMVVWKMVPLCIMRYLWRERNDRRFKILERTLVAPL